jgi:hypothetical protein
VCKDRTVIAHRRYIPFLLFLYRSAEYAKYYWVWRTDKGTHQATVPITVLTDALQLVVPMYGLAGVLQTVQLTYSLGPRGGKHPWFICPTCPRRVGVALDQRFDLIFRHVVAFRVEQMEHAPDTQLSTRLHSGQVFEVFATTQRGF